MKILILGGNGLVGSSLARVLQNKFKKDKIISSNRNEANLFSKGQTFKLIDRVKPDIIINSAAKVGGIEANNTQRTEFLLENLKININVLENLIYFPEIKLINLGSSCIYPLNAKNPISEMSLMTGKLEPTNSPYAMAKLTSIELGNAISKQYGIKIINLMPTNLYGPNDNFNSEFSHVIPGLITRMHKAKKANSKSFEVWGTGKPLREFLYVDDLSKAIAFIIKKNINDSLINIGSGSEISIKNLVFKIKQIIGFKGKIIFDTSRPDGNPRKLLNSNLINNYGWKAETELEKGLHKTYNWYQKSLKLNI